MDRLHLVSFTFSLKWLPYSRKMRFTDLNISTQVQGRWNCLERSGLLNQAQDSPPSNVLTGEVFKVISFLPISQSSICVVMHPLLFHSAFPPLLNHLTLGTTMNLFYTWCYFVNRSSIIRKSPTIEWMNTDEHRTAVSWVAGHQWRALLIPSLSEIRTSNLNGRSESAKGPTHHHSIWPNSKREIS